jgi:hypothetical protein
MENNLEEEAENLLREYANQRGSSLRKMGILDTRRLQVVKKREVPMTVLKDDMWKNHKGDN